MEISTPKVTNPAYARAAETFEAEADHFAFALTALKIVETLTAASNPAGQRRLANAIGNDKSIKKPISYEDLIEKIGEASTFIGAQRDMRVEQAKDCRDMAIGSSNPQPGADGL